MAGTVPHETTRPTTDDRVDILGRLDPDTIHPARLAGPHAWHPWGLTATPPDDRRIRLTLPSTQQAQDAVGQILASLADQLRRPSWPPQPVLTVHASTLGLTISRDGDTYARLSLDIAPSVARADTLGMPEVVTRDGWPILNELEALHDRIATINPHEPALADLNDLAHWTMSHLHSEQARPRLATPLRQLAEHPSLRDTGVSHQLNRSLTTLNSEGQLAPETRHALAYLQAQFAAHRSQPDPATTALTTPRRRG
jgi:hypothetical protein